MVPNGLRKTSPVKYIIDLPPHICPQAQEFPIDPVQNSFQEVSFSGVFTVKEIQQLWEEKFSQCLHTACLGKDTSNTRHCSCLAKTALSAE